MVDKSQKERCRLILIAPTSPDAGDLVGDALSGGDVASVIMPVGELNEQQYASHVEKLVPIIQHYQAAALVMFDTQVMGRSEADGIFVPSDVETMLEIKEKFHPKKIVGFGGAKNRHNSMVAGDIGPDFMFYGKVDGDIKAEAHPKNVQLAKWWSALVEIPCVVMAGSDIESVVEVSESGAEFVAVSKCIFESENGAKANIALANQLLDESAPELSWDD